MELSLPSHAAPSCRLPGCWATRPSRCGGARGAQVGEREEGKQETSGERPWRCGAGRTVSRSALLYAEYKRENGCAHAPLHRLRTTLTRRSPACLTQLLATPPSSLSPRSPWRRACCTWYRSHCSDPSFQTPSWCWAARASLEVLLRGSQHSTRRLASPMLHSCRLPCSVLRCGPNYARPLFRVLPFGLTHLYICRLTPRLHTRGAVEHG